jgi:hypothetical protein
VGSKFAPLAIAVCIAILFAGCVSPPPPSRLASIPKLLVDYVDNHTVLFITSINADVRYDNISISLSNANLTSNLSFRTAENYALLGNTTLTYFTLNATADESGTFYYYNATAHITQKAPAPVGGDPQYQIFIQETANGPIQQLAMPFRHVLEEGRA